ncbi:DUF6463 family protein [Azospira sp. I13]|nr:DUF6463 family protein [Azospira sp. I13]
MNWKSRHRGGPSLAIALLLLVGLGVLLMPASGFWLAIPPALALCRGRRP